MKKGSTIVITGVNGFIGSNLARECLRRGYSVIGIDIALTPIIRQIRYYQLNLYTENLDELLKENKPYAVVHCAGMADVSYSVSHPDSDFAANVIISRKILYSIKECSINSRFVFLSSAAVYGNPLVLPIREDTEQNPISPYALHKLLVEDICWYFIKQFNMDIKILRIFSAYGSGLKKQIFWDMGQKIGMTNKLELFGTGNETRDFIHIKDLVNAILLIVESGNECEKVYNIANGQEISIRTIAELFCEILKQNKNIIVFNQKEKVGNPSNWCADISKIREIGYEQTISIDTGIAEYIEWLKREKYI